MVIHSVTSDGKTQVEGWLLVCLGLSEPAAGGAQVDLVSCIYRSQRVTAPRRDLRCGDLATLIRASADRTPARLKRLHAVSGALTPLTLDLARIAGERHGSVNRRARRAI